MKAPSEILDELTGIVVEKADKATLNYFHKLITGADMGDCPLCRDEAVQLIKRWKEVHTAPDPYNCKYRFKEAYKGTEVFLRVGESRIKINAENLTDSTAERLLNDGRFQHLIEANPMYGTVEKKTEVKESQDSTSTSNGQPKEEANSSRKPRKSKQK